MTENRMKKYVPLLITIIPALLLYRMIIFGEIVTANDDLARHPINEWRDKYISENENMPQLPDTKVESNNAFFIKEKKFFNEFSPSSGQSKQQVNNVI